MPLPADTGGKIRTLNILRQAARCGKVHLLCFSFDSSDAQHISTLRGADIEVTLVPAREPHILRKLSIVLFHALPFPVVKYDAASMRQALAGLLTRATFDLVHVDHLHMAQYQPYFTHLPSVLDEHNVEYRIHERCADHERGFLKRLGYRQQSKKTRRFELDIVRRFNAVTAVSEDDANVLREGTGREVRVEVLPNGVDTEYFKAQDTRNISQEDALAFTGSMDWLPNDDAAQYFIKEILPLIWVKNLGVKFYVVGRSPSVQLQRSAASDQRIVVTGRVEDVRSFLAKAKVFVVPLRIGGGTRLKILEAMSFGTPVVSTTIGAEGIACTNGENIRIADEPNDFADTILTLLAQPAVQHRLTENGRKLVLAKYDWNIIGNKLRQLYEELTHVKK